MISLFQFGDSILFSNKWQTLKIGDFGATNADILSRRIASSFYMAPELFDNINNYTSNCDVYSFGITLCEMYTRRKPYDRCVETREKLIAEIRKRHLRPIIGDQVADELRIIIQL
jgi:serine/threonine protein kinase